MKITKSQLKIIIKEEIENVLNEKEETTTTKRTFGDKLTAIVNAWGGYRNAIARNAGTDEAGKKLIKVLKSFNVPKEVAIKIYRAEDQDDVVALVKGTGPAVPVPKKPVEKSDSAGKAKKADKCAQAKDFFKRMQKKGNLAEMRRAKKLIGKHCK